MSRTRRKTTRVIQPDVCFRRDSGISIQAAVYTGVCPSHAHANTCKRQTPCSTCVPWHRLILHLPEEHPSIVIAQNLDGNLEAVTWRPFREKTRTTSHTDCQCATGPIGEKGDPRPMNTVQCPRTCSRQEPFYLINCVRGAVRSRQAQTGVVSGNE